MSAAFGVGLSEHREDHKGAYVVEPQRSLFRVHAFASGLVSAVAHSPKFEINQWSAEAELLSEDPLRGNVMVQVNPQGLRLVDDVRESDRREIFRIMHSQVLETQMFPEIVFEGEWKATRKVNDSQYDARVEGSLRLHGVTNSFGFDASINLLSTGFRAQGKFAVSQNAFGIKTASIAGHTLCLRDELVFSFFAVGRRRDGTAR